MNDVAFCNSGNLNGKTRCVAKSSERNKKSPFINIENEHSKKGATSHTWIFTHTQ